MAHSFVRGYPLRRDVAWMTSKQKGPLGQISPERAFCLLSRASFYKALPPLLSYPESIGPFLIYYFRLVVV
jgi:hypothetical protein